MILKSLVSLLLAAALPAFAATPHAASAPSAEARVDATFAAWDTDKDHLLSPAEFKAGWAALQQATAVEAGLHRQFQAMDANHSGALEASEYSNLVLVKRAGTSAPPLSTFDANHDQRLQFDEYLQMVRRLGAQAASTEPRR